MINLKFDQNYSKVIFQPLIQKERQLQPFVDSTFQSHNNYMDTTRKEVLSCILRESKSIQLQIGNGSSLSELVLRDDVNKEKLYHRTSHKNGEMVLLYHKQNEDKMKKIPIGEN